MADRARRCGALLAMTGLLGWAVRSNGADRNAAVGRGSADPAIEQRIDVLLSRMTLEEKVGQLNQLHRKAPLPFDLVSAGGVGSFLNVTDPAEVAQLQAAARRSRLGIPLIFGFDVIHGYRTIFPVPLAEASSWDPALAERSTAIAAREAATVGLDWTFAPMVDIARDPRWGRIVEGAGEDPVLGSAFAAARVRGYRKGGLAACAKHYVGYGAAEAGRDYNGVELSESTLRDVYLPPFRAAVDAGAETLMSAFQTINGLPASANRHTLTEILRGEWGFDGFVVSDWDSVGELVSHAVAANGAEAAQKGLLAGVDMEMEGRTYANHLAKLVRDGVVPATAVDQAVRRVLRIKLRLGLWEKPSPNPPTAKATALSAENRRASREIARESMVLLKNQDGLLPLAVDRIDRMAVIGPLADSGTDQLGSWSGRGEAAEATTLLAALKARLPGRIQITYARGCDHKEKGAAGFADAVAAARDADVVLAVLGEAQDWSGEAGSRTRIDLPGGQQELLETLVGTGRPVVLVLMNGRPLAIAWAAEHVPAILEAWFPGTEGGPAVVDLLFGEANPSGKLPVTFPRSLGQVPIYHSVRPTGRPASAERYTSNYVDEQNEPLFPFGHGLSYTRFEYSELSVVPANVSVNDDVDVRVTVKNVGVRDGKEVVQVYVRDVVASRSRPVRQLVAFRKIALKAGEQQTVVLRLRVRDLGFHDDAGRYSVEPGGFQVFAGGSSLAGMATTVEVER